MASKMAAQGDLQELLRIFTSRKVPMLGAMKHVQALQSKNIKRYNPSASRSSLIVVANSLTRLIKH